jgi:hypothetical protein
MDGNANAEYLFYGISNGSVTSSASGCFNGGGCAIVPFVYNWASYNVQVARVAMSYKF